MNSKYPVIRFQKFPEEWLSTSLSSIVEDVSGNDGRTDLPVLTISAARGWLTQEERFSQVIAGSQLNNYTLLNKDELSYNKGNSKTAEYGVVYRLNNHDSALVPKIYHSFRTTKKSDSLFIEKLFDSKKPDQELMKIVTSGARMDGLLNINKKNFYSIKVIVPSLKEQTKIGEFFKELDELIELQQLTIDKLEEMKKGFLHKMFIEKHQTKPKLRIKNFSNEWKSKTLSEIVFFYNNERIPIEASKREKGKYPYYGATGIIDYINDYIFDGEYVLLAEDGANILTRNSPLAYLTKGKFWVNNHAHVLKSKTENNYFLMYRLEQESYVKYNTGTAQPKLNNEVVRNIKFYIPDPEEQTQIGEFFKKIDKLIDLERQELEALQEMKKGFLQKMFV